MSEMAANDPDDPGTALRSLSKRQRACLEKVGEGQTSKEIARDLDLSPKTVDHHIAAAIKTMGAHNRVEAALRLEELKRGAGTRGSSPREGQGFMFAGPMAGAAESQLSGPGPRKMPRAALPPLGGRVNDSPRNDRVFWMVRISILSLMITCALTLSILGLVELFGRLA